MKYKVGDKVKIKENKNHSKECKLDFDNISYKGVIKETTYNSWIDEDCYILEGLSWNFKEEEIIGLYKEPIYIPIYTRFEILDL